MKHRGRGKQNNRELDHRENKEAEILGSVCKKQIRGHKRNKKSLNTDERCVVQKERQSETRTAEQYLETALPTLKKVKLESRTMYTLTLID